MMEDMTGRIDQFKKDLDLFFDEITKNYNNSKNTLAEWQARLSYKEQELSTREAGFNQMLQEYKGQKASVENGLIDVEKIKRELLEKSKEMEAALMDAKNQTELFRQKESNLDGRLSKAIEQESKNNEKEKMLIDKESSLLALQKQLNLQQSKLNESRHD